MQIWWDILHVILWWYETTIVTWSPFHKRFFHRNANSVEISFYSHPSCREVITMKFCTWQDSFAVVPCAEFCSDMIPCNGVTLKPVFHKIWITMKISFMKWALGCSGLVPNMLHSENTHHYDQIDIIAWKHFCYWPFAAFPSQRACNTQLWCFFVECLNKQSSCQWLELPWHHCNVLNLRYQRISGLYVITHICPKFNQGWLCPEFNQGWPNWHWS